MFTQLDFTNNTTKHQAKLLATSLGIKKIVDHHNGTGFLLVIDRKTKLTKTQTVKEMAAQIKSLL